MKILWKIFNKFLKYHLKFKALSGTIILESKNKEGNGLKFLPKKRKNQINLQSISLILINTFRRSKFRKKKRQKEKRIDIISHNLPLSYSKYFYLFQILTEQSISYLQKK